MPVIDQYGTSGDQARPWSPECRPQLAPAGWSDLAPVPSPAVRVVDPDQVDLGALPDIDPETGHVWDGRADFGTRIPIGASRRVRWPDHPSGVQGCPVSGSGATGAISTVELGPARRCGWRAEFCSIWSASLSRLSAVSSRASQIIVLAAPSANPDTNTLTLSAFSVRTYLAPAPYQ